MNLNDTDVLQPSEAQKNSEPRDDFVKWTGLQKPSNQTNKRGSLSLKHHRLSMSLQKEEIILSDLSLQEVNEQHFNAEITNGSYPESSTSVPDQSKEVSTSLNFPPIIPPPLSQGGAPNSYTYAKKSHMNFMPKGLKLPPKGVNVPSRLIQPLPEQLEEEKRRQEPFPEEENPICGSPPLEDNELFGTSPKDEYCSPFLQTNSEQESELTQPIPTGVSTNIKDKQALRNSLTLSKSEQKKLEKQEKKETKKKLREEKKRSKLLKKSQDHILVEYKNDEEKLPNHLSEKKSSRWAINKVVQVNPNDGDWEDELKMELENKWKEMDSSEGPIMLSTIRQTVKKIWVRPLERLPLHSDLPRLVHGMEIVDETSGTMLFKEDGSYDNIARVREMIRTLVSETQDEETANEVISVFNSYKNNDNDIAVLLDGFLKKGCTRYEEEGSPWIKILKCVHQGIVFPVVFHMKKLFTDRFQYKDIKGSWKVRISIFKGGVEVEHRKSEKSYGTDADSNFSFQWHLSILIDQNFSNIDSNVSILNFILDKEMKKDTRAMLTGFMQPFLHGAAQYISIWRKPLRKLNIHRDFSRMCQRLSIFKSNGKELYTRKENKTNDIILKEVLLVLCRHLSPEILPSLEYALERYIKPSGDITEQLAKVFLEDKVVPDDSKLAAVLKCVNTTIVFPAIDLMHQSFYEKLRYRDVRGTWNVHITLGPNIRGRGFTGIREKIVEKQHDDLFVEPLPLLESSRNETIAMPEQSDSNLQYRYINIVHRKCEQSHSSDPKEYFMFEWITSITLNREMTTIKDVFFGIVDFSFGTHTSDETKAKVLTHIKPFLRPPTLSDASVSLDAKDIIDAAIRKIEDFEKHQHLINVFQSNLPHSLPLSILLKSLKVSIQEPCDVKIMREH